MLATDESLVEVLVEESHLGKLACELVQFHLMDCKFNHTKMKSVDSAFKAKYFIS